MWKKWPILSDAPLERACLANGVFSTSAPVILLQRLTEFFIHRVSPLSSFWLYPFKLCDRALSFTSRLIAAICVFIPAH